MNAWQERRAPDGVKRINEIRTEYERDRSRVIHSSAFRRLQAKTQILGVMEGDFHRTRLTHSMEVAQIGRGLVLKLRELNPAQFELLPGLEQIETIGLAHDLGHPPFGHGGETALNFVMASYGGFEGNGQTLRQLTRLESHTPNHGLDLTRRTLLGVLKYPATYSELCKTKLPGHKLLSGSSKSKAYWHPPKCILSSEQDVMDWILSPLSQTDQDQFRSLQTPTENQHGFSKHMALDASIMELADDIAYGVHDFEDGIALRLLNRDQWKMIAPSLDSDWAKKYGLENIENLLFDNTRHSGHSRKQGVGAIVHALVSSVELCQNQLFEEPLLAWNVRLQDAPKKFLTALKNAVSRYVIRLNTVQTATFRGSKIVLDLFQAFSSDPEMLLPESFVLLWRAAENEKAQKRILSDFIAGMTDQYANRFYERLFLPGHGSVFDRL